MIAGAPWVAILIVSLMALNLISIIIQRTQITIVRRFADENECRKFGRELVEMADDMFLFLEGREAEIIMGAPNGINSELQNYNDYYAATEAAFMDRFGTKALRNLAIIRTLGIGVPSYCRCDSTPNVFKLIGGFLAEGDIAGAIELSRSKGEKN